MKRIRSIAVTLALMLSVMPFSGCTVTPLEDGAETPGGAGEPAPAADNAEAFRLSSVEDVTNDQGERAYLVTAPYTDTYRMASENTVSIKVYDGDKVMAEEATELTVDLTEGAAYTLVVKTADANADFALHTEAVNHQITLPYGVGYTRGRHKYLAGKRRYRPACSRQSELYQA